MGDSGEGLVDANARIEERLEEMQENNRAAKQPAAPLDPDRVRAMESLKLAKIDLERQLSMTAYEARRQYLTEALAELDRRLSNFK